MNLQINIIAMSILTAAIFLSLSGCVVEYENEKPGCQALFENGSYKVNLSETIAKNCEEYAGAMIATKVCKGGLYCQQNNDTCICKRFE